MNHRSRFIPPLNIEGPLGIDGFQEFGQGFLRLAARVCFPCDKASIEVKYDDHLGSGPCDVGAPARQGNRSCYGSAQTSVSRQGNQNYSFAQRKCLPSSVTESLRVRHVKSAIRYFSDSGFSPPGFCELLKLSFLFWITDGDLHIFVERLSRTSSHQDGSVHLRTGETECMLSSLSRNPFSSDSRQIQIVQYDTTTST